MKEAAEEKLGRYMARLAGAKAQHNIELCNTRLCEPKANCNSLPPVISTKLFL